MRRVKQVLMLLILGIFMIHALWLVIEPLLGYLISALVIMSLVDVLYHRRWRRW